MRAVKEKMTAEELDVRMLDLINNGSAKEKEEGFEMLFKKYKHMIFTFLSKALNFDEETARDLMMDVFTKIHLKIDSYSADKGALSTWIFKITKNTFLDHINKAGNNTLSLDALSAGLGKESDNKDNKAYGFELEDRNISNDSIGLLIREERAIALTKALSAIKSGQEREILIARYLEQKSYSEISEEMNTPVNTIKVILHRGKINLKAILLKQGFVS